MVPGAIAGATRRIGKPDEMSDEQCLPLHIRDGYMHGFHCMSSAWYPSPSEAAAIARGAPIHLHISGRVHPVVMLTVGED